MSVRDRAAEFSEALADVRLIDTHEHVAAESLRQELQLDFTYLMPHYLSSDLVSAGMSVDDLEAIRTPGRAMRDGLRAGISPRDPGYPFPERLPAQELPLEEKWSRFAPYWERTRNTGYARCILIALRDLFGIEDLNEQTYRSVSERLQQSNRPGWYRHVMKERAGIDVSILDYGRTDVDRDLFAPAMRFDRWVDLRDQVDLRYFEGVTGLAIQSVGDLVSALEADMSQKAREGMAAVKTGLAYHRIISYGEATRHEAEQVFNRLFRHPGERLSWEEARPLQDYMMHQVIRCAIEQGRPIQVHTGLQEGNGNVLANSRPTLLVNLFQQYPRARFDLFHAGWPYSGELAALAKNFQNVYADMCWVYAISPWDAAAILHQWLETIPVAKILGFGGDWIIVEGAYGHSRIARQVVARVLAEKVEDGYVSACEALEFGRRILRDNAKELFGL